MVTMRTHKYYTALAGLIAEYGGPAPYGAEIGVHKGKLSAYLLQEFPDLRLLMVDPYKAWPPGTRYYEAHPELRLDEAAWLEVMAEAIRNARAAGPGRFCMSIMTSELASTLQADKSLDFAFLDGDHTYEGVRDDIKFWLPKCRKFIAGHDYGGTNDFRDGPYGVRRAVWEAFGKENILVWRKARVWAYLIPPQGEPLCPP